jgi:hypothetical protein
LATDEEEEENGASAWQLCGIRTRYARGGGGCMGCAWSGGGGRSADSANARWWVVTEPPWCRCACVGARWPGHTTMGRKRALSLFFPKF